jgi:tRNA threonylcarbamoyladenosine biosynthesis protein TsaB
VRALAIDTSTHRAEVALCDNGACVARERNTDPSKHAESLLTLIDKAFAATGWRKDDIDVVVPCLGPGSFTGIRVGLATAKGIAFALDKPIVGVSGLEAMVVSLAEYAPALASRADAVVALLDARKGEVFWAAHGPDGRLLGGPGHISAVRLNEILVALPPRRIFVGEITDGLDLPAAEIHRSRETDLPDVVALARLGVEALGRRGPDDLDTLEPIYLRPPDITLPRAK